MIEFKDAAVRRDGKLLFSDVNFQLHKSQKIGLTGNNGAGKSTLFAVLLGEHGLDAGQHQMPADWQIAHMAQEVMATHLTALDYVLSGDAEWHDIYTKIQAYDEQDNEQIAKLYQRFDEIDGFRTSAKAAQILAGLGFSEADHGRCVADFSGGWRMRLNLARTLMNRADVLLLDEPTNHLDLDAILWLEEWILKFDGLVLVISHDQAFLDAVCSHILHIEQAKITLYSGNYSQFIQTRSQRLAQEQQAYQKQQETRAHLEDYIRRFRAKATKAKQAQSRIKQLSAMTKLAPVMADSGFGFEFYPPSHMASPLMTLENAQIGYDKPLLSKVNLQITPEVRLGVLGANGAGKSTLMKALVGDLPIMSGVRKVSLTLKLGYFNQHQMDALDNEATPLTMLRRLAGQTSDAQLRAFLGSFGFQGDKIDTISRLFSGGERARLTLALIVWQRPNVLVLDEPTNHLDLQMRNALMLALQDFKGALILVSHDRNLIMAVCDQLVLVADGKVTEFTGDMADYTEHLRQIKLQKKTNQANEKPPSSDTQALSKEERRKHNAQIRKTTAPIRKKIDELEAVVQKSTEALSDIEERLSDQSLYDDINKEKLLDLLGQQSQLQKQINDGEEALLELMGELESLEVSLME
ncbi:ATP-binding cassette domain-containing protein [Moraxella nasovis]|uniref:ATP-binding cassette domain-containing protein n=1 Tax=Moraxella nasovis TaxID=2904121 RepID=UPI001F60BD2A|nr:ATP-binding cassette domain-containing protein [Moraxella nasovis]UNU74228.1 ATP-binding cassette domain-containing protein [Moraxella nasovis]